MSTPPAKPAKPVAPYSITPEAVAHASEIETLYDLVFGPGRYAKTAERLREGNEPIGQACRIATDADGFVGVVRFWPLTIGETGAGVLLGPLAVAPRRRGDGIAFKLMEEGVTACAELGWSIVILVGDEPYYSRAGFSRAAEGRFQLPGPVDARRILVRELTPEAQSLTGELSVPRATMPAS